MTWITIRTTSSRTEAEMMCQLLIANEIPARIVDLGISAYLGSASPTALQVQPQDRMTALLLLSPIEEEQADAEN